MNKMNCIACMSGTSLDGLDVIYCSFEEQNELPIFNIEAAKTYEYSKIWENKLRTAPELSGLYLTRLHNDFGALQAEFVNKFIAENNIKTIDFVAAHGHTVFHRPAERLTLQIGSGAVLAANTGLLAVTDFRTADVAHGGQGAPLVPIGDELLFSEYDACLNLGGFANISFKTNGKRLAFDCCPTNIVSNHYAKQLGKNYDISGNFGRKGEINNELLHTLNNLSFYEQKPPKSLGKEWVDANYMPLLENLDLSVYDKLRTHYEHVATVLANIFNQNKFENVLVTGGGAYNNFLIEILIAKTATKVIIPNDLIVQFKEALIFGYLAYLRLANKPNSLKSVTGASKDVIGGIINLP